jgi:hypothetical protein
MELDRSFLQDTHVRCMGGGIARRIFWALHSFLSDRVRFYSRRIFVSFLCDKGRQRQRNATQPNARQGIAGISIEVFFSFIGSTSRNVKM